MNIKILDIKGRYPHSVTKKINIIGDVIEREDFFTIRLDDSDLLDFWLEIDIEVRDRDVDVGKLVEKWSNETTPNY